MAAKKKIGTKSLGQKAPKMGGKQGKSATKAVKAKALVARSESLPHKPITQKQTKSQIYAELAALAQVSKHDAKSMVAAMRNLIERHVKAKGSGSITIPDLGIKVRRVHKKATKARMGRNPLTGEQVQISAKPARKSVKVSALKSLKSILQD